MRARSAGALAIALVIGIAVGALGSLAFQGERHGVPLAPAAPVDVPRTPEPADTILAWTPGGMPDGFAAAARGAPSVRHVAVVRSGVAWLTGSRSASGAVVDRPPHGFSIPLEVAGVDPTSYRVFLPAGDRGILAALAAGGAALGSSSATMRRLGAGSTLDFGPLRLPVAAVLPDELVGAHEVVVSMATASRLGVSRARYALIEPTAGSTVAVVTGAVRRVLPAGTPLRVRGPGETTYFRHGDAVLPPVKMKSTFGEFAARPIVGGQIEIDPVWVARHIATERVPILGAVTCNRALLPLVRAALEDVVRRGLSSLVDPSDYGGCFSPRFLLRDPAAGLSHHAWGAAIDLNVSTNPFGRLPHQDRRVVDAFERQGMTWGGRWLVPDGMHFEFVRFPLDQGR